MLQDSLHQAKVMTSMLQTFHSSQTSVAADKSQQPKLQSGLTLSLASHTRCRTAVPGAEHRAVEQPNGSCTLYNKLRLLLQPDCDERHSLKNPYAATNQSKQTHVPALLLVLHAISSACHSWLPATE